MVTSRAVSVVAEYVAVVVLGEVVAGLTTTLRARSFVSHTTLSGLAQVVRMSTTITESVGTSISVPLTLRRLATRKTTRPTTVKLRASLAVLQLVM